jgi:hypothetical protein
MKKLMPFALGLAIPELIQMTMIHVVDLMHNTQKKENADWKSTLTVIFRKAQIAETDSILMASSAWRPRLVAD